MAIKVMVGIPTTDYVHVHFANAAPVKASVHRKSIDHITYCIRWFWQNKANWG